jgi:hypothetical protein
MERRYLLPCVGATVDELLPLARTCDVIATGVISYAAPIVAQLAGVPWASVYFSPTFFNSAHDPPALGPLPWLPRLCRPLPLRLRRTLLDALRTAGGEASRRELNLVRAAHGLPPGLDGLSASMSPHAALLLTPTPLFPPQPDWPACARPCGAVLFDTLTAEAAAARPEDAPAAAALAAFLDVPGAPRPVVFALGSCVASGIVTSAVLVELFVATAAALPAGTRAVLVTGRVAWPRFVAAGLAAEAQAAGRLVALPWAPYSQLFPRAAAVVHQGGACFACLLPSWLRTSRDERSRTHLGRSLPRRRGHLRQGAAGGRADGGVPARVRHAGHGGPFGEGGRLADAAVPHALARGPRRRAAPPAGGAQLRRGCGRAARCRRRRGCVRCAQVYLLLHKFTLV